MSKQTLWRKSVDELVLEIHRRSTANEHSLVPQWLKEIQNFRGRVIWDKGNRPSFKTPDGEYVDAQKSDLEAYHILLRAPGTGQVIGCVWLAPLESLHQSHVRDSFQELSHDIFKKNGLAASDVLEGGRLIVDADWQGLGASSRLLLAGTALAQLLDRRLIWGTAGVRHGQERVFLRLGYFWAGDELQADASVNDELRMVICEPMNLPGEISTAVNDALATVSAALHECDKPEI
ncbi:hypothetical protein [Streptomyces sp. NPDC048508]|uniref:hypothetical protein n=1 Tax=Streptomyces sp. NPDC048508 TaxID=3365561 RepID=UPI0037126C85